MHRGSACRNRIWTGEIHLARPAASGKVTVLSADHDLIRTGGNSRSGVDAGATAGFEHDRTGLFEYIQIALRQAVFTSLFQPKLTLKLTAIGNPLALFESFGQDLRVHI